MAKTTERKLVFSAPNGAKITKANLKISDDGKNVELIMYSEVADSDEFDKAFPIIDPSELIGHKIWRHKPETRRQEELLDKLLMCFELNLPAFRVSCMDPSEENGKIVFKPGNKPAVGHSAFWWNETWRTFMPSKNSRSGTDLHWAAFLGMLMKYLIDEKNYSVGAAWMAVCDDSRDLGHYWNSKDAKHEFEPTGSRKIGEHFDLANAFKFLKKWGHYCDSLIAGGDYDAVGDFFPLADLAPLSDAREDSDCAVGWLVLDV